MSALGTNALIKYGDALLQNGKYPYAILAYEAAIVSYKLRTGETFDKLTRRLCIICVSNKDFDRALKYHLQILNQAMKEVPEPNVNEIVYVSETISTLQLEQGNFEQAESYLKSAAQFLTAQLKEKSEGKRKTSTQPSQGRSSIYKYGKYFKANSLWAVYLGSVFLNTAWPNPGITLPESKVFWTYSAIFSLEGRPPPKSFFIDSNHLTTS